MSPHIQPSTDPVQSGPRNPDVVTLKTPQKRPLCERDGNTLTPPFKKRLKSDDSHHAFHSPDENAIHPSRLPNSSETVYSETDGAIAASMKPHTGRSLSASERVEHDTPVEQHDSRSQTSDLRDSGNSGDLRSVSVLVGEEPLAERRVNLDGSRDDHDSDMQECQVQSGTPAVSPRSQNDGMVESEKMLQYSSIPPLPEQALLCSTAVGFSSSQEPLSQTSTLVDTEDGASVCLART